MSFILKGLSARAKVGYDDFLAHTVKYTVSGVPEYSVVITDPTDKDGYYLVKNNYEYPYTASESYNDRYRNLYLEASVNYSQKFGKNRITALALYNQKTENDPSFEYDLPKGLLGFVGRVTYNYDNRYLAEFNMGYNGSENFAEGRRFGFFPAYSLGWLVTEEKFIPENKLLTYLKIRGSYGEVGNDKIGGSRYLYLPSTYTYGSNGYNFGTYGENVQYYPASAEGTIGNPYVTWERAQKSNIGIDMKLFSDKLSFTGDLFWEKRDNILWEYGTMPSIIGATLSAANLGKVNNRGAEFELGWESEIQDFRYRLVGTFFYAKNKIIYMDEPTPPYDYLSQTGYSVNQYKGYINEGFINTVADLENQPAHGWGSNWDRGELNFIDVNGDGIINSYDKVCIGYGPYPEINYGFTVDLGWKNFEINALFQGAANVTLYLKQSAVCPLYYSRSAQKWHLGRWTEERYLAGETITYPRMLSDNINSPSFIDQSPMSTFWLYNASYLRLRNLEIAYNYKTTELKKWGISLIRLYLSGTNLLTFSDMENFDPEAPSGAGTFYPMQKIYNIGFKITF
jgi:TonB-linked SusC/RagA family outer membrane protein